MVHTIDSNYCQVTPSIALATLNLAKLHNKTFYDDVFQLLSFWQPFEVNGVSSKCDGDVTESRILLHSLSQIKRFLLLLQKRPDENITASIGFFVCFIPASHITVVHYWIFFPLQLIKENISRLKNISLTVSPFVSFGFFDFGITTLLSSTSSSHLTQNLCSAHSVLWSFLSFISFENNVHFKCTLDQYMLWIYEAAGKPISNMKWFLWRNNMFRTFNLCLWQQFAMLSTGNDRKMPEREML